MFALKRKVRRVTEARQDYLWEIPFQNNHSQNHHNRDHSHEGTDLRIM